jgi:hypothetical protein
VQASLDGGVPPSSGTFLPTGSHMYVVSFSNCLVDGWTGTLNGVASAAYDAAEWSNVTVTVSADSVRGRYLHFLSDLNDVTADGSAVAKGEEQRFDNLKVAINGTEYTLNGSLDTTYGFSGSRTHTGEVRIINNGTLVARIYDDARNALTIEVLVPLVPF